MSDREPDKATYWLSWADYVAPTPITLEQLEEYFQKLYDLGRQPETRI